MHGGSRVSIALALCAVLMGSALIAGCSAPAVTPVVSPDAMPARQIVMPGYKVTIPASFAQDFRFVVAGSADPVPTQWIGNGVSVEHADGTYAAFFVVCCSDDWGPQEALYQRKLGPLATAEGTSVYVCQSRLGEDGEPVEDALDEYAPYVQLTVGDELAEAYETPYYALQLPADLASSCVIEYDDYARTEEDGSGEIGHTTSVLDRETGNLLFFVLCGTDSFAPDEGDTRGAKLGEPSQLPGTNVYVGQLAFDLGGGSPTRTRRDTPRSSRCARGPSRHPSSRSASSTRRCRFALNRSRSSSSKAAGPFVRPPWRRTFFSSWRMCMSRSMVVSVYTRPRTPMARACRPSAMAASPMSCVTTMSPGSSSCTMAKSAASAPMPTGSVSTQNPSRGSRGSPRLMCRARFCVALPATTAGNAFLRATARVSDVTGQASASM